MNFRFGLARTLTVLLPLLLTIVTTSVLAENVSYEYAPVLQTDPIVKRFRVSTPREECWEEDVAYRQSSPYGRNGYDHDSRPLVGAVLGGAVGNALGHSKRNKQVGVVVGALLGASLAKSASRPHSEPQYREVRETFRTEQRCRVYNDFHEEERIVGYWVRYRFNDQTYTSRMNRDPGDRIRVRLSVSPVF